MIRFAAKDSKTEENCIAAFEGADIISLEDYKDEFAILTKSAPEGEIKAKLAALDAEVLSFIRMEG